jgi:hypothetical protein
MAIEVTAVVHLSHPKHVCRAHRTLVHAQNADVVRRSVPVTFRTFQLQRSGVASVADGRWSVGRHLWLLDDVTHCMVAHSTSTPKPPLGFEDCLAELTGNKWQSGSPKCYRNASTYPRTSFHMPVTIPAGQDTGPVWIGQTFAQT